MPLALPLLGLPTIVRALRPVRDHSRFAANGLREARHDTLPVGRVIGREIHSRGRMCGGLVPELMCMLKRKGVLVR